MLPQKKPKTLNIHITHSVLQALIKIDTWQRRELGDSVYMGGKGERGGGSKGVPKRSRILTKSHTYPCQGLESLLDNPFQYTLEEHIHNLQIQGKPVKTDIQEFTNL